METSRRDASFIVLFRNPSVEDDVDPYHKVFKILKPRGGNKRSMKDIFTWLQLIDHLSLKIVFTCSKIKFKAHIINQYI